MIIDACGDFFYFLRYQGTVSSGKMPNGTLLERSDKGYREWTDFTFYFMDEHEVIYVDIEA